MNKQCNKTAKNALHQTKSLYRNGQKGDAKKIATRANRRARKMACQEELQPEYWESDESEALAKVAVDIDPDKLCEAVAVAIAILT
jgi:hypothetical protein